MVIRRYVLAVVCAFTAVASSGQAPFGEIPLTNPPLVPSLYYEQSPAIASDGNGYLAVWIQGSSVRAARLDARGELVDRESIAVSRAPYYDIVPNSVEVAWNGASYVAIYGNSRYALIASSGEVLLRDAQLSVPIGHVLNVIANGTGILVSSYAPGPPTKYFNTLFDNNLNLIGKVNIGGNQNGVVATPDGFVVCGQTISKIANTGTTTTIVSLPNQPYGVAGASDGRNVLVGWADTDSAAHVHTMLLRADNAGGWTAGPITTLTNAAGFQVVITHASDGYLVTWWSAWDGPLVGERVNDDGQQIDAQPVTFTSAIPTRGYTRGVSNGTSHVRFWLDGRRTPLYQQEDLWAAAIQPSLASAHEFPVAISRAAQFNPSGAFNGSVGLVTWAESGVDTLSRVVYTRVDANGTPLDAAGVELAHDGTLPSVATDGQNFLLVWRDAFMPPLNFQGVHSALITPEGAIVRGETLATKAGTSAPHVTYDGQQFFVVWSDVGHVYGEHISRSGVAVEAMPFDYGVGEQPSVAWDGSTYIVPFAGQYDTKTGILRVSRDGFPVGAPVPFEDPGFNPVTSNMACTGGTCLVVWRRDMSGVASGAAAAILTSTGLGSILPLSSSGESAPPPAVAVEGDHYLVGSPAGRAARIATSAKILESFTLLDAGGTTPLVLNGKSELIVSRRDLPDDPMSTRLFVHRLEEHVRRRAVR